MDNTRQTFNRFMETDEGPLKFQESIRLYLDNQADAEALCRCVRHVMSMAFTLGTIEGEINMLENIGGWPETLALLRASRDAVLAVKEGS